jgi:hypothetical protein
MEDLDWQDIVLHWVGALVIVAAAGQAGWLGLGLILNAIAWPARELWQHRAKGQNWHVIFTRPQVLAEWAIPSALSPIVWLAM